MLLLIFSGQQGSPPEPARSPRKIVASVVEPSAEAGVSARIVASALASGVASVEIQDA